VGFYAMSSQELGVPGRPRGAGTPPPPPPPFPPRWCNYNNV
jgi:hypothetical protein